MKVILDGRGRRPSVRLVVNPEKMVIAEARRTYTYLGLFGYRVDAVVVNRVLPPDVTDPYFGKWKDIQAEHLATVHESFEPVPILLSRLFDREMVGIPLLEEMGEEVYGELDRGRRSCTTTTRSVCARRDDGYVLSDAAPVRLPRRHGHPPARRGAGRPRRVVQAQPDPAAVAEAHGRPRSELAGDHLEIVFGRGSQPADPERG